jgi:hypothetical protein
MSDGCLLILHKWLVEQKDRIYNEHVKSDNDENELQTYGISLEEYAEDIIRGIEKNDTDMLKKLRWPDSLMKCIGDEDTRIDIKDAIRSSFITYPFNRSEIHRKELERENAGLQ